MKAKKILKGKKILIVDDEQDVLDVLIELLDVCKIETASTFEDAEQMLEKYFYDIVILDIMGVSGYALLDIATQKKIPAMILTAHALTEENLIKSAKNGAAYFVPKEKIIDIDLYVTDVLTALKMKKNTWENWFDRLGSYFDNRFSGTNWREKEQEFLERIIKTKLYL
jgi:DNA-binding NtrC family response regulator